MHSHRGALRHNRQGREARQLLHFLGVLNGIAQRFSCKRQPYAECQSGSQGEFDVASLVWPHWNSRDGSFINDVDVRGLQDLA